MAWGQYRPIGIWIVLEMIGFEWFSAHAEGFLKAVGLTGRLAPFRFDWRFDSPDGLRHSALIDGNRRRGLCYNPKGSSSNSYWVEVFLLDYPKSKRVVT